MTPADIDRVFGRGRQRMTTGEHVEVFREEAKEGEARTFTKRFLETASGDFRPWTEREWRILERLAAHGDAPVAEVVRFIDFDDSGLARLQTRDAGLTVDQWAALVPLRRSAPVLPYVFGDCPNWWALARQCLVALDALHRQGFVHLDFRSDNVCIPWKPAGPERPGAGQPLAPDFDALALIDVAFSLLPEVDVPGPLPLAREPGYEYQSPRLLQALDEGRRGNLAPTLELDWRCDIFSLAAMLWRYLPELDDAAGTGWTSQRHASAAAFVRLLLEVHGEPLPALRPHGELIAQAGLRLTDPQFAAALQAGSTFDPERAWPHGAEAMPLTRIAPNVADRTTRAARRGPAHAPVRRSAPAPVASVPPAGAAATDIAASARASAPVGSPPPVASEALGASPPAVGPLSPIPRPPTASAPSAASLGVATSPPAATPRPTASPEAAPMPAPLATPAPWATPARVLGSEPITTPMQATAPMAARVAERAARPAPTSAQARLAAPAPAPSTPAARTGASATAATPPRAAPAPRNAAEHPPTPIRPLAPTPVPILATAGIGALLIAAAVWWGIDGRTSGERTTQRAAAPPASAAATTARNAAASPTIQTPAREAAADPALPAAPAASTGTAPVGTAPAANEGASAPSADSGETRVAAPPTSPEFDAAAVDWMRNRIPQLAKDAERQVAPVLALAGRAPEMRRRGEIRSAARSMRTSAAATAPAAQANAAQARSLNDAALTAYWLDNNVTDALHLGMQALGANPFDSEVVGNLAFLRLKETPPEAETVRQLALHALTVQDLRFETGRIEDWTTLAIASALTGRDAEARNAWFVSMALTSDLQRQCNAAVRAQATYGERLRPSVQAMLLRARSSPAYGRCEVAPMTSSTNRAKPSSKTAAKRAKRTIP